MDKEALNKLRKEYSDKQLDEADVGTDPFAFFRSWFSQAEESGIYEPNAMALSTVSKDGGSPVSRMVLLKEFTEEGEFVFYSNYKSQKGAEIAANQNVALLFYWDVLHRQVRVEGSCSRISRERSEAYFRTRPPGAQMGAVSSPQSAKLADRAELEAIVKGNEESLPSGEDIPLPDHWGGYAVTPSYIEFWQGRRSRLHDRICFDHSGGSWNRFRRAP